MDPAIIFITIFVLIIIIFLFFSIYYIKQKNLNLKNHLNDNKLFYIILLVFFITYSVYQWYLYREKKKKEDLFQTKKATNTCPDYWTNVSTDKDTLVCKNTKKLGKYNLNTVKTFDGIYQDPKNGDKNKCHYAKIAKISWEGIDNLCTDIE